MICIRKLFIFPIKSLAPISVDEIELESAGFRGDRRFMLVDAQGTFITQRTRPDLTRFRLNVHAEGFEVWDQISGLTKLLKHNPELLERAHVELWDDQLIVCEVGEGWSAWFSERLQEPVRLVMQLAESPRIIAEKYQTEGSNQSSFADSLPVLLASENSYARLAEVYGKPFDYHRFRANMIVSGAAAFEEDTWEEVSISNVRLSGAKPCARCQLVNVEPSTGEVEKGGLMKALASFRQKDNKVYFGQQMVPIQLGTIRVGDELTVINRKDALF
jgi:uncharacterized protein YcbX